MTFRFVAVLVGRKCFAITRVLGFLCDVLLCLLYSDVQKSLRFPLMATKQRSRWWIWLQEQCQGSWAASVTLEAELFWVSITAFLFSD